MLELSDLLLLELVESCELDALPDDWDSLPLSLSVVISMESKGLYCMSSVL